MNYADKLRDPRWQAVRRRILLRDQLACVACGCHNRQLDVHHKWYVNDPWDAPDEALETLCHACHQWRTETQLWLKRIGTAELRDYVHGGKHHRARLSKMIDQAADAFSV